MLWLSVTGVARSGDAAVLSVDNDTVDCNNLDATSPLTMTPLTIAAWDATSLIRDARCTREACDYGWHRQAAAARCVRSLIHSRMVRRVRQQPRASGGIGRRAGFRFLCPKGREGSSPSSRTAPSHTDCLRQGCLLGSAVPGHAGGARGMCSR